MGFGVWGLGFGVWGFGFGVPEGAALVLYGFRSLGPRVSGRSGALVGRVV